MTRTPLMQMLKRRDVLTGRCRDRRGADAAAACECGPGEHRDLGAGLAGLTAAHVLRTEFSLHADV